MKRNDFEFYRYHVQYVLQCGGLRTYDFHVFSPFDLAKVVNRTGVSLNARLAYVFDNEGVYLGSQVPCKDYCGLPSEGWQQFQGDAARRSASSVRGWPRLCWRFLLLRWRALRASMCCVSRRFF